MTEKNEVATGEQTDEKKFAYFKYELSADIYLKVERALIEDQKEDSKSKVNRKTLESSSVLKALTSLKFKKAPSPFTQKSKELQRRSFSPFLFKKKNLGSEQTNNDHVHLLTITRANQKVAQRMKSVFFGMEKYGDEILTPKENYSVYCYNHIGMIVFSEAFREWEMGLLKNSGVDNQVKVMLTRYLSWLLVDKNILSFWAVPVKEGIVVRGQKDSNYEAVFIDLDNQLLLTEEGKKDLPSFLQVFRLESGQINDSRKMSREELLSFLTYHSTYFASNGLPLKLKKRIYDFVYLCEGTNYPLDRFQARESL